MRACPETGKTWRLRTDWRPDARSGCNSFMAASEISANYGSVFATKSNGGKVYIAEKVNLKFIPDMVSFSQYNTVLFKSPEYLLKFWNSVILVAPIVIFQLIVATLASYGFARYRGRIREIIFFMYIILMLMPYVPADQVHAQDS